MISEGLELMAVGMFTVFAFLTLLVGMMTATAAFFEAFAHRFPENPVVVSTTTGSTNDAEIALALSIAEAVRRGQKV